jgi:hypothetical protein
MKKLNLLIFCFIIALSTNSIIAQDDPKTMTPPDGKGIIYIINPRTSSGLRSVNKCDGNDLPSMAGHDYIYVVVDAGKHTITSKGASRATPIDVTVESGKKYYIVQTLKGPIFAYYYGLALETNEKKINKYMDNCTLIK